MADYKVGLGWDVAERDFNTLQLFIAGIDPNVYNRAICKGLVLTSNYTIPGTYPEGLLIEGETPYIGNNHFDLAVCDGGGLTIGASNVIVRYLRLAGPSNFLHAALIANAGTSNAWFEYCHVSIKATNTTGVVSSAAAGDNRGWRNCVINFSPRVTGYATGYGTNVEFWNCVLFGYSGTGLQSITGGGGNRRFVNNIAPDIGSATAFNITTFSQFSNNATADGSGQHTGYGRSEFVDFEAGDYRIKSDSDLAILGIGAFFDTAPAENPQNHTTGGTLTAVSTASAAITPINKQKITTSAQQISVGTATATTSASNKQTIATSATALAVTTAQAQSEPVNAQNRRAFGNVTAIATAIATSSAANKQNIATSATGIHIFTGYADTTAVNETGGIQHAASGGTLLSVGTASASTSAANKQNKTTGATAIGIFTASATTSSINQIPQLAALVYELKTRTRFTQTIETSGRHAHQVRSKTRHHYELKTRSGG